MSPGIPNKVVTPSVIKLNGMLNSKKLPITLAQYNRKRPNTICRIPLPVHWISLHFCFDTRAKISKHTDTIIPIVK